VIHTKPLNPLMPEYWTWW